MIGESNPPCAELREALTKALEPRCVLTYADQRDQFQWIRALKVLDAFEDAHPGLRDLSKPCCLCGTMVNPVDAASLLRYVDQDWHWSIFGSNHELYDDLYGNYLCPACAEELE